MPHHYTVIEESGQLLDAVYGAVAYLFARRLVFVLGLRGLCLFHFGDRCNEGAQLAPFNDVLDQK